MCLLSITTRPKQITLFPSYHLTPLTVQPAALLVLHLKARGPTCPVPNHPCPKNNSPPIVPTPLAPPAHALRKARPAPLRTPANTASPPPPSPSSASKTSTISPN